ncbi:hypothetical protein FIBSPDRAFT_902358 [Athelia psychrophila]|uniref:Uncharacterized protein n=1 Tax=Athelia psychrophila TaxID=1759441 RepID=A0A167XB86_9AGAM|nr:hypothetical protein FIBSPDRAFT_902358 [Fibularhizoctonia sp. CBS 109695]
MSLASVVIAPVGPELSSGIFYWGPRQARDSEPFGNCMLRGMGSTNPNRSRLCSMGVHTTVFEPRGAFNNISWTSPIFLISALWARVRFGRTSSTPICPPLNAAVAIWQLHDVPSRLAEFRGGGTDLRVIGATTAPRHTVPLAMEIFSWPTIIASEAAVSSGTQAAWLESIKPAVCRPAKQESNTMSDNLRRDLPRLEGEGLKEFWPASRERENLGCRCSVLAPCFKFQAFEVLQFLLDGTVKFEILRDPFTRLELDGRWLNRMTQEDDPYAYILRWRRARHRGWFSPPVVATKRSAHTW